MFIKKTQNLIENLIFQNFVLYVVIKSQKFKAVKIITRSQQYFQLFKIFLKR